MCYPLFVFSGKVDTAKALIDLGAQLDVENIYGTPLHIAGFGANLDGVKLMYEKYPEVSIYFHNKPYTYMCCKK